MCEVIDRGVELIEFVFELYFLLRKCSLFKKECFFKLFELSLRLLGLFGLFVELIFSLLPFFGEEQIESCEYILEKEFVE